MAQKNYLDTYWYRVSKMGITHKERELNAAIGNFEKFLAEHPSSETIMVNGIEELAAIISNKQDENKLTKKLLTRLTSSVAPGTLVTWKDVLWIVYFQEKNPNEAYHSNLMVQANSKVKWVNSYGALQQSPCYIVGNMMSSVKNNFRTWMGLITPQPNQYVDFLIPFHKDVEIGMKLLIQNRAWKIVEFDAISVPGILYVSCTEDKVDRLDDDSALQIAEYNKLGSYAITALETDIEVVEGSTYIVRPVVKKNGIIVPDMALKYKIVNELVATVTNILEGAKISGLLIGSTSLIVKLVKEPNVTLDLPVVVVEHPTKTADYIVSGSDIIRLGTTEVYELYEVDSEDTLLSIDSFSVSNSTLVTGTLVGGKLKLTANSKGALGTTQITLSHGNPIEVSVEKTVTIKSLW